MQELTREQNLAITVAKRAMKRLAKCGLTVVMVDGSACIYLMDDYREANENGDIDCGFVGLSNGEGNSISYIDSLTNIVH